MSKKIIILLVLTMLLLCGCEKSEPSQEVTASGISEAHTESVPSETEESIPAETAESVSFSFAKAETEAEESTISETEETKAERVLKDNQIAYSNRNIDLLMEFTGAENLVYYPKMINVANRREDSYVLHAYMQVTNLSKKSFNFIPQNITIYGSNKNTREFMMPVKQKDKGLIASDSYYTVEPGQTVSFSVDFVGKKFCIEHAYEIKYSSNYFRGDGNTDTVKLDNTEAGYFDLNKRSEVKKAVKAALDIMDHVPEAPSKLTPKDGEYSVLTPKNSYCFTVEPLDNGKYIRVALRLQCLTGEPEAFDPNKFMLHAAGQKKQRVSSWSFDTSLVEYTPDTAPYTIAGVSGPLYYYSWDLYVRPDGSAEYTMYFFADSDLGDYYMFSYDGENDVFDCIIDIE